MEYTVFVYGTLRKNLGWHHLLKNGNFIGNSMTKEKYSLYADNIPYVIEHEKLVEITGEVYKVDDLTLKVLDTLEGHPNWYQRKEIQVIVEKQEIKSWIYFFPKPYGQIIQSGDYLDYRNNPSYK